MIDNKIIQCKCCGSPHSECFIKDGLCYNCNKYLKQQLEEKDKQIDIISRDNNSYKYNIDEQKRIIDDFAKQLKEKDKEIERLKNLFELNNEVVINQGREMFDLRVQVLQQKQNQIQLTIQELEKVKDYICDCTYIDYTNIRRKIDNQIKKLKGE